MKALIVFLILVLGTGVFFGAAIVLGEIRRRMVVARTPPEALVEHTDSVAVARARRDAHARHRKAIRLLGEVRRHDDTMTFLPAELRKDIDEAVEEFYQG